MHSLCVQRVKHKIQFFVIFFIVVKPNSASKLILQPQNLRTVTKATKLELKPVRDIRQFMGLPVEADK